MESFCGLILKCLFTPTFWIRTKCAKTLYVYIPKLNRLGLILFIWISFNPSMDGKTVTLLILPKFQWCSPESFFKCPQNGGYFVLWQKWIAALCVYHNFISIKDWTTVHKTETYFMENTWFVSSPLVVTAITVRLLNNSPKSGSSVPDCTST